MRIRLHPSRGLAAWLLLAVIAAAAGGCRARRRTPDDTVVYVIDTEITELDPRYALTSNDTKISRLVAAGLIAVDDATLEPRPDLAERLTRKDPLTWEVTIRPEARFPDGSPVTADDVVYTFSSILRPEMRSIYRREFDERLAGVEAVDERTARFRLKQPLATFVTDLDFGIVSRRAAEAQPGGRWGDGTCVGAGPYRVVSLVPGKVLLERNEHYHGGPPPTPRLVIQTIRDANARLLVLVGGSADIAQNTVRPDLVAVLGRKPRLRVEHGPSAILTYLMFQNEDPILRDPRVRRAIALAIDREQIVRVKYGGLAVLATGLLPPGHWAYEPKVDAYPHDPAQARRLLDEAGHPDPDGPGGLPRFSLTYKTSADPFRIGVARIIAQELGEVGIAVEVRSFEFGTFFADVKQGNYQLASMQTSEIVEPDMNYTFFHSSRIPTPAQQDLKNRWRYRNAEIDRLTEAGRHELDPAARRRIYGDVQRILAHDLPVLPLWHEDNVAIVNVDLQGYQVLPNARLSALARVTKQRR